MSQPTKKAKRRWFQFSLRSLLMAAALVALAALAWRWYVAPYQRQRQTMVLVESLGGSYQTAQAPAWLRRVYGSNFQNVLLVNLADCDDPARYLDQVAALPVLEALVVGGSAFNDDHLRRLHGVTTLRGLVLDCTNVTDSGLASLRDALPRVEIYQSERRSIAVLRKLGQVATDLNSSHTQLRQRAGDEWFDELCVFHASNSFSDADLANLRGSSRLVALRLSRTQVSDAGLIHVKTLSQLRTLDLNGTQVSDAGLSHLKELGQLDDLWLSRTQVSDAGLIHLKALRQLRFLSLDSTQVSDVGLAQLEELKQLAIVCTWHTKVTDAGAAALRRALPNCKVDAGAD